MSEETSKSNVVDLGEWFTVVEQAKILKKQGRIPGVTLWLRGYRAALIAKGFSVVFPLVLTEKLDDGSVRSYCDLQGMVHTLHISKNRTTAHDKTSDKSGIDPARVELLGVMYGQKDLAFYTDILEKIRKKPEQ